MPLIPAVPLAIGNVVAVETLGDGYRFARPAGSVTQARVEAAAADMAHPAFVTTVEVPQVGGGSAKLMVWLSANGYVLVTVDELRTSVSLCKRLGMPEPEPVQLEA